MNTEKKDWLRLPVVSAGSEYFVMGLLMRRNILTYKAPPGNEGYDLICIHPDPRHRPTKGQKAQIRVQVKSRYATDCNRSFPVKERSLKAFDYLIVAFMNIGKFYRHNDGSTGSSQPEIFTFPRKFIQQHHDKSSSWEKVMLKPLGKRIDKFKDEYGIELIAKELGVLRPKKNRD